MDDEVLMRETISLAFESLGHDVKVARDGHEALRLLDSGLDIDLLLLDHNMTGITGAETLGRLRENHPDLPVILSTGYLDRDAEILLSGHSHVWILRKPYRKQEIQQTIAAIFRD